MSHFLPLSPRFASYGALAVAFSLWSLGCGSTVTFGGPGEDGGGGSGPGGAGGGGEPCVPAESCNPPQCPSTPPAWEDCPAVDLSCTYDSGTCRLTYECSFFEDCYDDFCESWTGWRTGAASCEPEAVPCGEAVDGDPCAFPGDSCGQGYDCESTDVSCGADHVWHVSTYYDECCYDDCCYGDCYCDPYYCPDTLPENGAPCDPCFDSPSCSYELELECGVVSLSAVCDPSTYTWSVPTLPPCPG